MSSQRSRAGSPPRVWGKRLQARLSWLVFRFTPTRVGKTPCSPPILETSSVHPHACGENRREEWRAAVGVGSPPRVWGKRNGSRRMAAGGRFTPTRVGKTHVGPYPCHIIRFTPTRVGKTVGCGSMIRCTSVHPHACGENCSTPRSPRGGSGSPPRVWGKRDCFSIAALLHRFTPTRVGKTRAPACARARCAVHPHACGENVSNTWHALKVAGSPPRVWGKRGCRFHRARRLRFTPTRVGKTSSAGGPAVSPSVHPHACGENRLRRGVCAATGGSPPRVWGKRAIARTHPGRSRFTPTRVGKTRRGWATIPATTVHPHACGENPAPLVARQALLGSPPRVWGKPRCVPSQPSAWRFTPTRVGKTSWVQTRMMASSVHPHACGENVKPCQHQMHRVGSPPRVWGKPPPGPPVPTRLRFTPTRVGKTVARRAGSAGLSVHPHACGENLSGAHWRRDRYGSPPRVWGKPPR